MEHSTEPTSSTVQLTRFDKVLLVVAIAAALGVSVIGLFASYSTLSDVAGHRWGWKHPWVLPIGIDLAIPAFTLGGLLLIRFDIPVGWVPLFPRALTAATVYLNWSADRTFPGRLGHAALVMLWVVFSEIAGRVYAHFAELRDETRMERVRRVRWILAPFSTLSLWRRMQLWEITSYREALRMERNRKLARATLRERFGRFWRRHTPRTELVQLRMGELAPVNLAEVPSNQVQAPAAEPIREPAEVPKPVPPEPSKPEPQAQPEPLNLTRKTPKRTTSTPATPAPVKDQGGATPSVSKQVEQILSLIEEHGYDTVKLGFVQEQTGMSKTTAYNRLVEARAVWSEQHEQ